MDTNQFAVRNIMCGPMFILESVNTKVASYRSTKCPPNLVADCLEVITNTHQNFKNSELSYCMNVPVKAGLDKILNLLQIQHYLIILNDFQGAEFDEPNYPTFLRALRLTWLGKQKFGGGGCLSGFHYVQD